MYDEYIPSDSPRLAPAGFFTNRDDIPRYLLNGSGNCRFAYVVIGQEAANRLAEQLIDFTNIRFSLPNLMMERDAGVNVDEVIEQQYEMVPEILSDDEHIAQLPHLLV